MTGVQTCALPISVSRNEIGKSVLVKFPKKDNINDAKVLFLAPVFPIKNSITFGSQSIIFKKWLSGDKKAMASKEKLVLCGIKFSSNNFLIFCKSLSMFLSVTSNRE